MRIAVIGNGNVGSGLSRILGEAGHEVTTIGRNDDLSTAVAKAEVVVVATPCGAIADLADKADFPVLLGATWAHSGFGWSFSNEGGGWEYPLFWAVVQGVVAVLGRGAFALRVPQLDQRLGQFA
ncbi:NAD(P)-binding domain-containing protein [Sulfitobacter faviae]|uniref:NAD(P)-binding domain-containing protein n=1 Tax=Sulfitobacter faviae TaxID=1775881 RepID=A0AAX3LRN8_9RHOB|nr:NAD(P)-binding domain-containing protein [Sulfitobacter faviae]WCE70933.1 NAD(P)-binding domain-containing protein [Sulfitobacter faviae]